ncbi:MAG: hypothetical protein ACM3X1_07635 [Ignavibacteriales bacterium]
MLFFDTLISNKPARKLNSVTIHGPTSTLAIVLPVIGGIVYLLPNLNLV